METEILAFEAREVKLETGEDFLGHPLLIVLKMTSISSAKPFGATCSRPICYYCCAVESRSLLLNLGGALPTPLPTLLITTFKFSPRPAGKGRQEEPILFAASPPHSGFD